MKKTTTIAILSIIFIIFTSIFTTGCTKNKDEFYLGKKYKTEIEKIINDEYPKSIQEIDKVFEDFEKETNPYLKKNIIDYGISEVVFYFYQKLLHKTNEYTNLNLEELETDWEGDLMIMLYPYLKNNKVNMRKINAFNNYADKKREELEKRGNNTTYPED